MSEGTFSGAAARSAKIFVHHNVHIYSKDWYILTPYHTSPKVRWMSGKKCRPSSDGAAICGV